MYRRFNKYQILSVLGSVFLTLGIFVWGLPVLQNGLNHRSGLSDTVAQSALVQEPVPVVVKQPSNLSDEPLFLPDSLKALQIKASGEDPIRPSAMRSGDDSLGSSYESLMGRASNYQMTRNRPDASYSFAAPDSLRGAVSFWVRVFGKDGKYQYLFHHKDDVSILYSELDLTDLAPEKSGLSDQQVDALINQKLSEEKKRIAIYLNNLSSKIRTGEPLDLAEQQTVGLFAQNGRLSIKDAADNIRIQGGFSHRFREALILSGQYMKQMEQIFISKGLPIELTRLPLIESAFNIRAYSSASAAGIWQFIPETGQRYLKIDGVTDERYDPILSTYAAATHLSKEFELLGSWPLTINAYNTGPGRMMKAINQLGTNDIGVIIKDFKDPGYQFYSRNYFPEFLAALHVYENQERYFGRLNKLAPFKFDYFISQNPVNLRLLAQSLDVDPAILDRLNPALQDEVLTGGKILPEGYYVRVPQSLGRVFAQASSFQAVDSAYSKWHLVKDGDTLDTVAKFYRVNREELRNMNGLLPGEVPPPGLMIKIPSVQEDLALNPLEKQGFNKSVDSLPQ